MHEAVFEAGWDAGALMPRHRAVIAGAHHGAGGNTDNIFRQRWMLVVVFDG
jgi:hypothetical protein